MLAKNLLEIQHPSLRPLRKNLAPLAVRKDDFTSICPILNNDFINSVKDLKVHPYDYDPEHKSHFFP